MGASWNQRSIICADRSAAGMKDKGETVLPLSVAIVLLELYASFPNSWPFPAKTAGPSGKTATESSNVQGCCWRLQALGYPGKERWEKAALREEEGSTRDLDFHSLRSPGVKRFLADPTADVAAWPRHKIRKRDLDFHSLMSLGVKSFLADPTTDVAA